ncbi:MAG: hypothetical protein FJ123_05525 [Deltaproteobacteria bacterium]|nr:hypothetical protein [Deltaproteobacteria bacterium]
MAICKPDFNDGQRIDHYHSAKLIARTYFSISTWEWIYDNFALEFVDLKETIDQAVRGVRAGGRTVVVEIE